MFPLKDFTPTNTLGEWRIYATVSLMLHCMNLDIQADTIVLSPVISQTPSLNVLVDCA